MNTILSNLLDCDEHRAMSLCELDTRIYLARQIYKCPAKQMLLGIKLSKDIEKWIRINRKSATFNTDWFIPALLREITHKHLHDTNYSQYQMRRDKRFVENGIKKFGGIAIESYLDHVDERMSWRHTIPEYYEEGSANIVIYLQEDYYKKLKQTNRHRSRPLWRQQTASGFIL